VAMHNREHIIILRPGLKGILSHTMYYQDEIREVDEFRTDTSLVRDKELDLAKMLISSLEAEFEPQKYHDAYRENLHKMIEAKIEGQNIVATPETHVAPVIDIMEALKKSLAEKRDIMEALKKSLAEKRKPAAIATAAQSQEESPAEAEPKKREPKSRVS
jgi:DNA end-binding protein Ku